MKADSDAAAAGNAESERTRMFFLDFLYIALSIFYLYIANIGWQLFHYTVYGTQKSDN